MRKRTEKLLDREGLTGDYQAPLQPSPVTKRGSNWKAKRAPAPKSLISPKWELPAWERENRVGIQRPEGLYNPKNPIWIKYREGAELKMRQSVPKRIAQLLREYWGIDPMPFQVEIIRRGLEGGQHVVSIPTDYGKSFFGCVLHPILGLMHDPDYSYGITGANIRDPRRSIMNIQGYLQTNAELIRDFPWIGRPTDKNSRLWSRSELNIVGRSKNDRNPSVAIFGLGANDMRGRRCKLLMDDIEGSKDRYSVVKQEALYDFIMQEAIRCYEKGVNLNGVGIPHPLMMLLGTPFHPDSIYFRVANKGFETLIAPWIEDGKQLWPEKWDRVQEFKSKMNRKEFAIAFEMDPTGGDRSMMSLDDAKALALGANEIEDRTFSKTLVSIDPAGGTGNKRADYAGVTVFRILWRAEDELPNVEVLEAHQFTEGAYEQVKLCEHLSAKWSEREGRPVPVVYETNSQQGGTYSSLFRNLAPQVTLIRHHTTEGNKLDSHMGISVVKTLLKLDKLLLVTEELNEDEGMQQLLTEITHMHPGSNYHDHLAASIWFGIRWAYIQRRTNRGPQIVSGFVPGAGARYGGYRPRVTAYRNF